MKRLRIGVLAGWLALIVAVAPAGAQPAAAVPVDALRRGGHVLLMRYGVVEMVQEPSPIDLADCSVQHRLADRGREQAGELGAAFRRLTIPVGQVLSSPYCRAREFAGLAFGSFQVVQALLHPTYLPIPGAPVPPPFEQRVESVKQLLAIPPAAGTNTVIITHGPVVARVAGFEMAMAEAAIFRPDGQGGAALVARVLLEQWPAQPAPAQLPRTGEAEFGGYGLLAVGAMLLLAGCAFGRRARRG
jgi:phosphohistidine phosphatase SixA